MFKSKNRSRGESRSASVQPRAADKTANVSVDRKALLFGLASVFLCGMGFSIMMPVIPFLVLPYTDPGNQAIMVTLLTSVYALCVFAAAPGIGALSDRYGRRPLLLICLAVSAIGYALFGMGGALWVLFAGRILEGLAGGVIGTLFAYFADTIPGDQRTRYFGWMGAMVGAGTLIGPSLGGLLANFGYAVPMYAAAVVTLCNAAFGFFFMKESLDKNRRSERIAVAELNPLRQLAALLSAPKLKRLLIAAFLLWVPNGSLQAIFSQFTIDAFHWDPVRIGLLFSIMGIQDILSQGLIMPQLLKKLGDRQIARLGMGAEIVGYGLIAASAWFSMYPLLICGMLAFGFGDSIFGPAFNGMLSKAADASEQGRIQGGSQSVQALARMIGPIAGGQAYVLLGHAAPAVMGMLLIAAAFVVLRRKQLAKRVAF
ncbi:MFS transporter [Saccharibacillus brassicae]|uniref:MFS transporter n=1 Tax=Saccharibacillus brassicae TaxID=2583377 RepID=A0A4Y6V0E6_SACBS|nr:MFS transporter [Saccharibacillus brassicae]QDH21947.1 MFS transporter [Saccharibacillus brassicae]